MHALILNNVVVDISDKPFEVASPLTWVEFDSDVTTGMHYINDEFVLKDNAPVLSEEDIFKQEKRNRLNEISNIIVSTSKGITFDGDEDSQNRMARAISIMNDTDTIDWVLYDNTIKSVSKSDLSEALKLAGLEMSKIWIKPYINYNKDK